MHDVASDLNEAERNILRAALGAHGERRLSRQIGVSRHTLSRLLAGLMEQLSFEHREILHLAYYQEFSVQEIADALDLPANTVKTRMFYARQRLKVLLEKSGVEGMVA